MCRLRICYCWFPAGIPSCWSAPGSAITASSAAAATTPPAKLLGLGYPGGPAIERAAQNGDPRRFDLPRPLKGRPGCDFSFSGLKTAVRQIIAAGTALERGDIADLAAAIESAICDTILDRTANAIR